MNQQQVGPPWLGLAVVECPSCRRAVGFDDESRMTVIHEASRSTQSAWSIGVSCPACQARIVTRVALAASKSTPTVEIVGFSETHSSQKR